MKRQFLFILLIPLLIGCEDKCETTRSYTFFEPVYLSLDEARAGYGIEGPQTLSKPGKIYLFGKYVFINEAGEGIHILDNGDPSNPAVISFISIPGNFDMAVKGSVLYADSYIDLLTIDITNPEQPSLIQRLENAFPRYNTQFGFEAVGNNVITGWEEKETVEMVDYCRSTGVMPLSFGVAVQADVALAAESGGGSSPFGVGGSLARFALQKDFLYAVDSYDMHVFSTTDPSNPEWLNTVNVGWNVETIFPFKNRLFVGSMAGMFIYNTDNGLEPEFLSEFQHATACDPVVANDTHAFVTLRSGTQCAGFTNQMDIIDVEDLLNPFLVGTVQMSNPYGLGLDGTTVFICEGEFGLRVMDVSDVNNPGTIKVFTNINVHDVIPWNNVLLAIGEDGLYQYDYTDLEDITQLSFLPIQPTEE